MILSGFYKNKIDQSFSKIIFTLKHGNITISIFSVKLISLQMKLISLILLLINQKKNHFVPNLFFLPSKVNNSNNNKKKVESI